jgi:hypothetical protein
MGSLWALQKFGSPDDKHLKPENRPQAAFSRAQSRLTFQAVANDP